MLHEQLRIPRILDRVKKTFWGQVNQEPMVLQVGEGLAVSVGPDSDLMSYQILEGQSRWGSAVIAPGTPLVGKIGDMVRLQPNIVLPSGNNYETFRYNTDLIIWEYPPSDIASHKRRPRYWVSQPASGTTGSLTAMVQGRKRVRVFIDATTSTTAAHTIVFYSGVALPGVNSSDGVSTPVFREGIIPTGASIAAVVPPGEIRHIQLNAFDHGVDSMDWLRVVWSSSVVGQRPDFLRIEAYDE